MTTAQKQRIEAAEKDAKAAGSKLRHRRLGNGTVLVAETYRGRRTVALLGTDGNYIDPKFSPEVRIFLAYEQLVQWETRDWVQLMHLRPKVKITRAKVDATLLRMIRTGLVVLAPESSRRRNDDDMVAAAITIGGEAHHIIAFEPEYDPIG